MQVISSVSTIRTSDGTTIGWLPVFNAYDQTVDMQIAASRDEGSSWWRPERRSAIRPAQLGDWGSGMKWPFRRFVFDPADPSKLFAFFSGCQGRHGDIHSTLAGERWARMREEWTSFGQWGYTNIRSPAAGEQYNPVKTTNFFRGALMRTHWDPRRLWALIPSAGGDVGDQ